MVRSSDNGESMTGDDFDYLLELIHYLKGSHNVFFFITTRDFDILYRWWEKGIPLKVVKEAVDKVVSRWRKKNKPISGFGNFYHEVKKTFRMFCEMKVGDQVRHGTARTDSKGDLINFLQQFPPELAEVKKDFMDFSTGGKNITIQTLQELYDKILTLFQDDSELQTKLKLFMKNIAGELKSTELERRFKINYLINKFNIPDLEVEEIET